MWAAEGHTPLCVGRPVQQGAEPGKVLFTQQRDVVMTMVSRRLAEEVTQCEPRPFVPRQPRAQLHLKPRLSAVFVHDKTENVVKVTALTLEILVLQIREAEAVFILTLHAMNCTTIKAICYASDIPNESVQLVLEDVINLFF